MRAIFLENINKDLTNITITGEKVHHLLNVVRLKVDQEVLLLNGKGLTCRSMVSGLTKKSINLDILSVSESEKSKKSISIAISQLKKDALDLVIKMGTELGVDKIFIMETEFSQKYKLNLDRINKLSVSSLEQSNNPFLPEVELVKLKSLSLDSFEQVILFTTDRDINTDVADSKDTLIVIGPEAGFSESEEKYFMELKNSTSIRLDIPIMRAPTAAACAVGYFLGRIES